LQSSIPESCKLKFPIIAGLNNQPKRLVHFIIVK